MLSNNFWSIFLYIKGLKFEDIETSAIRMKSKNQLLVNGRWTKFENWFTQVGLKIQGVKASEK